MLAENAHTKLAKKLVKSKEVEEIRRMGEEVIIRNVRKTGKEGRMMINTKIDE